MKKKTQKISIDLKKIKHIHFIGIAGSGMGAIAEVLLTKGFKISGSDVNYNSLAQHLEELGAKICTQHVSKNILGADLIVYSSAIQKSNPELQAALKAKIPAISRGQMLAELMSSEFGIAIAGTHGKTTTTALVATLLSEGGLDPTFVIGGLLRGVNTHARLGGKFFVAEADESDASFLYMLPEILVVTNIDNDHMNNYHDFSDLKQTFLEFMHRLNENGLAIICSDDHVINEIKPQIKRKYITYGFNKTDDVYAESFTQEGVRCKMNVHRKNYPVLDVTLNLPGRHNVLNSLAAIAVATQCNVADDAIIRGLEKFQGTGRRFQIYGELNIPNKEQKVLVIDDYGHHPREIAATLDAVRKAWPERRLVLAFQPHRYSRTQAVFEDFVKVLSLPDVLFLLEIYSAGETPISGITGEALCSAIKQASHNVLHFVSEIKNLPQALQSELKDGDILLLQGAGDIGKIAGHLVNGEKIE